METQDALIRSIHVNGSDKFVIEIKGSEFTGLLDACNLPNGAKADSLPVGVSGYILEDTDNQLPANTPHPFEIDKIYYIEQ